MCYCIVLLDVLLYCTIGCCIFVTPIPSLQLPCLLLIAELLVGGFVVHRNAHHIPKKFQLY